MTLREALLSLPQTVFDGANRYDTDDKHVLHLWVGGVSYDIEVPKAEDDPTVTDRPVEEDAL